MAQLTISFTTDPSASFYRIKYRRAGTATYTTVTTTSSPMVISSGIDCGYAYEGTIQTVCTPGTSCYNFTITNPDMMQDGDVEYTNCTTGETVTQAVLPGANFIVCSRTFPIIYNMSSASVQQGAVCGSGGQEEASAEVPWSAAAVDCVFYWAVTACNPESPVPPSNAVKTNNSSIGLNDFVQLTGSSYIGHCYQITDVTTVTTGPVIDDATGIFTSCFNCEQAL